MGSPVHVSVVLAIVVTDGSNHGLRFLRGRPIIQIDQWLAATAACQDGEVVTNVHDCSLAPPTRAVSA